MAKARVNAQTALAVAILPEVRENYVRFFSNAIVQGTKTILEHIENPDLVDELQNDKYRLRKLLGLLDLSKNEVYHYVCYY